MLTGEMRIQITLRIIPCYIKDWEDWVDTMVDTEIHTMDTDRGADGIQRWRYLG